MTVIHSACGTAVVPLTESEWRRLDWHARDWVRCPRCEVFTRLTWNPDEGDQP